MAVAAWPIFITVQHGLTHSLVLSLSLSLCTFSIENVQETCSRQPLSITAQTQRW
jgi:hypothetical protein